MKMEEADMVIVGAGFAGLAMGRTYLKLNPEVNLLILDAGTAIGGVWAPDRLYPFLRAVSQLGHFEYSDFPMTGYGVAPEEHMKGEVIQQYLQDYADTFDLTRRTRLNSVVQEAEDKGASGWLLTISTKDGNGNPQTYHLLASKLVMATGLTSTPKIPSFPGQSHFDAPVIHSRDFGQFSPQILRPGSRVAVLSGNKSACDVVYAAAASGAAEVHWILRSSGHGPCLMAPPRNARNVLGEELLTTRASTWQMSPCIWGPADGFGWVRALINRTARGQAWMRDAARNGQAGIERANGYDSHPELAKLRPWTEVFWIGTGRGLLNYGKPDVLDFVREGRIKVHIADVESLAEGRTIKLSNGEELAGIDSFVCCTGWKHEPNLRFTRDAGRDIAAELGLPHAYDPAVDEDNRRTALLARADNEILSTLPRLREQPPPATCPPQYLAAQKTAPKAARRTEDDEIINQPTRSLARAYTLYRFMIPPSHSLPHRHHHRTIAFVGYARTASTALMAQTQALWLSAFFMGRSLPALNRNGGAAQEEKVEYEAILHARQGRWRNPLGFGAIVPDFTYDALPYIDLLLRELGLPRWRKRWSPPSWLSFLPVSVPALWREVFEWYGPVDYRGLVEEWAAKEGIPLGGSGKGKEGIVEGKGAPLPYSALLSTAVLGAIVAGTWFGMGRPRWVEVSGMVRRIL
ncbi:FAD-binding monooxygenase andJ [Lasiodiplodia theobromae]|uniref:FAD-binding monooxygenase andJ n=1 Tax=Lasiodiplodia theobromae TaxID=45133 RepID=A0A5N5DFG4_9PEZI|nr:FAD-binding monooxygenase andJ [Lasiodiplodia theobromae]